MSTTTAYTSNQIFNLVSFSIILVLGTIGNLFVIYVYGFTASRRFMKFERLMLMLGVFDLIASIANPAHYIYRITHGNVWHLGEFGCKTIPALGPLFTSISLGMILIMAIDRDRAVATPFKSQLHLKTIYKAVAVNISLCVLVTVPYIHYSIYKKHGGLPYCYVDSDYTYNVLVIIIFLISDLIFLLVFTITTYRVFKKLKTKDTIGCQKMREHRARETNRILKIITAMGVMFVLCVFPRDLLLVTFSFTQIYPPSIPFAVASKANLVLKVFHTSNSCVNVILYSLLNKKFRREIFKLVMRNKTLRTIYWSQYPSRRVMSPESSYDSSFNNSTANSTLERHSSNKQNGSKNAAHSLLKHVLTKPHEMETTA